MGQLRGERSGADFRMAKNNQMADTTTVYQETGLATRC